MSKNVRALLLSLLVVAIADPVSGDSFDLGVPLDFRLRDATLLVGALRLDGPDWSEPVVLEAAHADLLDGSLVVCAKRTRSVLAPDVPGSEAGCADPATHDVERIDFGLGTDLRFYGAHQVVALPEATMTVLTGEERHAVAHIFSNQPLRLAREAGPFRFEPASPESTVLVDGAGGSVWYNGTEWEFTFDGPEVALYAGGAAGWYDGDLTLRLRPGERGDVREVLDPFRLLDLQELLLGADSREPRANVTGLLTEYGRVSDYVNGALVGRLNGTIGERRHLGDVSLVRVEGLHATLAGQRLAGELTPVVEVTPSGIAIGGGGLWEAPWKLVAGLWIAALAVSLVRRHPAARTRSQLAVRVAAPVAGFVLVDLSVMAHAFGNSALSGGWRGDFDVPDLLALVAFELVTLAAAALLVLLPLRVMLGRFVRERALLAELVLVVAWLASLALLPGAYFALGHDLARL